MAKQKKEKRVNKTKDQLLKEQQIVQETKRKRERVRSDLYPFLMSKNSTVDEMHQLCYLMGQFIRQGFIGLQNTMKLEELKMDVVLKGDDMKNYLALYDMFRHETVQGALEFVEGMAKQIDDTVRAGTKDKKFEELDLKLFTAEEIAKMK